MFKSWSLVILVGGLYLMILWGGLGRIGLAYASQGEVLAEILEQRLTSEDVQILLETDPQIKELIKQKPELKDQIKKLVIDRWLNITLLYLYGKEKGLDKEPAFRKKLTEVEKFMLAEEVLQRELSGLKPSEEELKKFYERNKEFYTQPEKIKVKHILIGVPEEADKTTREKAFTKAKKIRMEILRGAKFEEMAQKYSDDLNSKGKGGDLGIIQRGQTIPEFENKVFALKEGQISEPISSPYGYHIVKVEKKIPAKLKTYEEVKKQVEEDYLKEKEREVLSKLLESLKQKYQPKVYHGAQTGSAK